MIIAQNIPAGQMTHKRGMAFDELCKRVEQLGLTKRRDVTSWRVYDLDGNLLAKWLPRTRMLYYNGGNGGHQVDASDELDPGTMDDDLKAEHFFRDRRSTSGRGSSGGDPNERQFRCDAPDEFWLERGYVKMATVGGFEWVRAMTAAVSDEAQEV